MANLDLTELTAGTPPYHPDTLFELDVPGIGTRSGKLGDILSVLGTPVSGILTNATGLPISTGVSGLAAGVATFLATPSSANLVGAVTDETGSGALVFGTSPVLAGTPTAPTAAPGTGNTQIATTAYADAAAAAVVAAADAMVFKGVIDCSANPNYPAANRGETYRVSVAGKIGGAAGPNVEIGDLLMCLTDGTVSGTHAAVGADWTIAQTNMDGALISGGALGTPSSGTLTNATGLPVGTGISGLGTGVATFLGTPSSANLLAALTDKTGTGVNVFGTGPTITSPTLAGTTIINGTVLVGGATASFNGPGGFARAYQWYTSTGSQWGRHSLDAFGVANVYTKSRHATVGSHTAVVAEDNLVNLDFAGSDGASYITGAQIHSKVDGTVSTGIVPARIIMRTMNAAGTLADRVFLNSSGGFRIGTTNVDHGANNLGVQGAIIYSGMTYANRPGTPVTGMVINITDSTVATWGTTVAGGGANNVLARYNGTNWTVIGA